MSNSQENQKSAFILSKYFLLSICLLSIISFIGVLKFKMKYEWRDHNHIMTQTEDSSESLLRLKRSSEVSRASYHSN